MCLLRGTSWLFVCFGWIWEQTAIISLYSINWLVCMTERKCVYCAVRAEYLYVLCGSQNKQRLFPYTALTDWFLKPRWSVFTARYELGIYNKFRRGSIFKGLSTVLSRESWLVTFWWIVMKIRLTPATRAGLTISSDRRLLPIVLP
jgi:hypothetical protein